MHKRLFIAFIVCAAIAFGVIASQAQAKPKTWHRVITMSGGAETYTGQYDSRSFRLYGGRLKLVAHVTPDPDLAELGIEDWWLATFYVERIAKYAYNSFYATMDPTEGATTDMQWTFRLPKGKYYSHPNTANCEWSYTLHEKR